MVAGGGRVGFDLELVVEAQRRLDQAYARLSELPEIDPDALAACWPGATASDFRAMLRELLERLEDVRENTRNAALAGSDQIGRTVASFGAVDSEHVLTTDELHQELSLLPATAEADVDADTAAAPHYQRPAGTAAPVSAAPTYQRPASGSGS